MTVGEVLTWLRENPSLIISVLLFFHLIVMGRISKSLADIVELMNVVKWWQSKEGGA
jgi:hypothetical protein